LNRTAAFAEFDSARSWLRSSIPAASQDISLPPVISELDSLTFLLPHCGPCDNFVI